MELTEHTAGPHHQIQRIEADRVFISDRWYDRSLVVGARYLDDDWPVGSLDALDQRHLEPLIELRPELVIVGAGQRQQILDPSLQAALMRRGIGVECMTLDAAARTFNVLMSEDRRALAALIIGAAGSPGD